MGELYQKGRFLIMTDLNKILNENNSAKNKYENLKAQVAKLHRHARQGSYKTRERYYYAVLLFCKFLAIVFHLEKLENVSGKHLCAYVEYRQEEGKAASTILDDLCAIRYYHDQMGAPRYRLPSNEELAADLERRRFAEDDRRWTEEEYNSFVQLAIDLQRQDYAHAFILAHELGLRIHEVFRLDTATVNAALKADEITVVGKGGKVRTVPLTHAAKRALEEQAKSTPPGEKIFVSNEEPTHIAIHNLEAFIRQYRDQIRDSAYPIPLTFHGLRHTFAANTYKRLISQGYTEFDAHIRVSRLLGHERTDVTEIYIVGCKKGYDN